MEQTIIIFSMTHNSVGDL